MLSAFYFPATVREISRSRSSSSAALLRFTAPHLSHLCITMNPRFGSVSAPIGRRAPPHSQALSPGFISICTDQRQYGQWFLDVYPSGSTFLPQWMQVNPLSFFVNLFTSIGSAFSSLYSVPVGFRRLLYLVFARLIVLFAA